MKLTHKEILDLTQAHVAFAKAEEGRPAFKLGPKARYNLTRNLRLLNSEARDVLVTRDKLIEEISPETKSIEPGTEQMTTFNQRMRAFLEETEEIDVRTVNLKDLNLDENDISMTLICDLGVVIVDDET